MRLYPLVLGGKIKISDPLPVYSKSKDKAFTKRGQLWAKIVVSVRNMRASVKLRKFEITPLSSSMFQTNSYNVSFFGCYPEFKSERSQAFLDRIPGSNNREVLS